MQVPRVPGTSISSAEETSMKLGETSLQFVQRTLIRQMVSSVAAMEATFSNSAFNFKSNTGILKMDYLCVFINVSSNPTVDSG